MSKVTIVDDIFPKEINNYLYDLIIKEPIWNLNMYSREDAHKIVGCVLFDKRVNINKETNINALVALIYEFIKIRVDFLSNNFVRAHLGAKAPLQDDIQHKDGEEDETTVLFYLNDEWKKNWGGETIVEGKKIEYKPNRAIIFPSNVMHGGNAPKVKKFRPYINYVVKNI